MAIADTTIKIDGQIYYPGDTLPDMGSLMRDKNGDYFGFIVDRAKLPVYDDLAHGTGAILADPAGADETIVLNYHAPTKQWIKL